MKSILTTAGLFVLGLGIGATGAWQAAHRSGDQPAAAAPVSTLLDAEPTGDPRSIDVTAGIDLFAGLDGMTSRVSAAPGHALDALAELAWRDPETAYARALTVTSTQLREAALERVAEVWALHDPEAAFEALAGLSDPVVRRAFGNTVLATLASIDPVWTLARLEDLDAENTALTSDALAVIAARVPDALRTAIEQTSDQALRERLAAALVRSIADDNPVEAARIAGTLSPSIETRFLFSEIGRQFAARDPDGAIAWAMALEGGATAQLMSAIFDTIAGNDLGRAIELSASNVGSQFDLSPLFFVSRSSRGYANVSTTVINNLERMPEIVERLIASDHSRAKAAVDSALESWALADPDSAMNWLLAQGSGVAPAHVAALAAGFSHSDVQMTAAAVDLMPPASQGEWISEVAAVYMQRDADAALAWLSRYRGDTRYGSWVSAAAISMRANSVFGFDPEPAIRLLSTTDRPEPAAVTAIVGHWARQEPATAGEWALGLREPAARAAGAAATVAGWKDGDLEAASRWALGLAAGEVRDAALGLIVTRTITDGSIDARVINAYSNDASREAALIDALPGLSLLARQEPAQARAIINRYYSTPRLQQLAERALEGQRLPQN